MTRYIALLEGEDRTVFTIEVEAADRREAYHLIEEEAYPEATILELLSEDRWNQREADREQRVANWYDDPMHDDYDY